MGKDHDLLEACRTGTTATVEKLLAAKYVKRGSKASIGSGGALSTKISQSLLSLKCPNVNCADGSGETPLHLAALNGHREIVSILLDCEASPTILDTQDCSPLHLAAWNGHTEICNLLLQSPQGQTLINLQTREGNTALHFTAQHGHDNTSCLLLQKCADPTIRNLEDLSPLDLAAQYDRLDIVKLLVKSHPELVAQRSAQNTPLHLASRNGHRAVVQFLLDSGFPVDARTDKGTALHEAANFCKLDVIKLLLERGIDITVKSQTGCTAEDILRSIPSKAAEDAYNILKAHIYHQRTPDSDGEMGIVPNQSAELPLPSIAPKTSPPSIAPKTSPPSIAPKTSPPSQGLPLTVPVETSANEQRKTFLQKRRRKIVTWVLPPNGDLSLPPPIPPRQSVRAERSDSISDSSLTPLRIRSDRGSEKDLSSDEDKNKLSPRDISPSARSPSEQPKKPPRKKPLSFRRTEPGHLASADAPLSTGASNYVNLDPDVERAIIDAKMSIQLESRKNQDIANPPTQLNNSDNPTVIPQVAENNNEKHSSEMLKSQAEAVIIKGDDTADSNIVSEVVISPETTDIDEKKSEQSSKPPSSLDIGHIGDGAEANPRSPTHHRQPPTPDCPPPSPGTALQNIQRKMQPMEKRKSRDMETITDSAITGPGGSSPSDSTVDLLTPVKEETTVAVVGKPQKQKPKPLPRKSSLSSDTRDIIVAHPVAHHDSVVVTELHPLRPEDCNNSQHDDGGHVLRSHQDQEVSEEERRVHLADGRSSSESSVILSLLDDGTTCADVNGEKVQMRRSLSAGVEPMEWEGHVFAGLFRGSVIGPARDIAHQLGGNNVTTLWKKRKSTLSTFAPVMEEDKDLDPEKILSEIDNIGAGKESDKKKSDDDVFEDDWAKIAEIISSYGGRISSSGDYALFEAQIEHLLSSKGENKIQSVGEWLSDVGLPQYENTLVANGFDDTDFLGGGILEDQDLIIIGIGDGSHRKAILEAAAKLSKLHPIDPSNLPHTVAEWLGSLRLDYYFDTFMSHKYDSMDRVIKIWELELVTVLDITSIGHRKRILASLGERRVDTSTSPARTRLPSLESLGGPKSPFDHVDLYRDYTGVRSKVSDAGSDSDLVQGNLIDFDNSNPSSPAQGRSIRDDTIHIRAPHLMHYTGAIKQWRHKPEILIKGCCNYTAHYLGSTLVKELNGPMSTQEGITKLKHRLRRKLQKSSEVISKIPTIMLSISFKGVKFIDAASKKVVCDHEIANIFCACQDGEHMNFFAYITKDRETARNYCHVFSVRNRELAGEIILTLGEAFEIAYQMALKDRAELEAEEFEKLSTSDGDDTTSISSKASINTV
ncbi:ankyrin repeat and SAM domain-containing protein 1A-like isoform X2 [Physella acuta]|uniref:ankyrin repeat and SAM domain-containing protein 1A-like isoform X2 n=1 Tax=Physella acuta TaxID=109671 RepID=UPI0027DD0FF1|nr:ankyrin repeat and SAM domain-containing protein 1A-like isoform X2 [Physella acuta]